MIEHWCSVCCNRCGRRTEERQPNVRAAREAAKAIGWKIGVRLAKYHPPVDYCPQCEQAGRIGGGGVVSETLANRVISRLESLLALAMTSGERDLAVTLRRHLSEAINHSGPHPPEPATWTCGTIRWLAQKYEVDGG